MTTELAKSGACATSDAKINARLFGYAAARDRDICSNWLNFRLDLLQGIILSGQA